LFKGIEAVVVGGAATGGGSVGLVSFPAVVPELAGAFAGGGFFLAWLGFGFGLPRGFAGVVFPDWLDGGMITVG